LLGLYFFFFNFYFNQGLDANPLKNKISLVRLPSLFARMPFLATLYVVVPLVFGDGGPFSFLMAASFFSLACVPRPSPFFAPIGLLHLSYTNTPSDVRFFFLV